MRLRSMPGRLLARWEKEGDFHQTQGLDDGVSPYRPAAVTELVGSEIGNRILLVKKEYWMARTLMRDLPPG